MSMVAMVTALIIPRQIITNPLSCRSAITGTKSMTMRSNDFGRYARSGNHGKSRPGDYWISCCDQPHDLQRRAQGLASHICRSRHDCNGNGDDGADTVLLWVACKTWRILRLCSSATWALTGCRLQSVVDWGLIDAESYGETSHDCCGLASRMGIDDARGCCRMAQAQWKSVASWALASPHGNAD